MVLAVEIYESVGIVDPSSASGEVILGPVCLLVDDIGVGNNGRLAYGVNPLKSIGICDGKYFTF